MKIIIEVEESVNDFELEQILAYLEEEQAWVKKATLVKEGCEKCSENCKVI
jgi:hypothetical protein